MSNVNCPQGGSVCTHPHLCPTLGCQKVTVGIRLMTPPNEFPLPPRRDAELAKVKRQRDRAVELLREMESEKSDYMIRNKLGDPANEHTNKRVRAFLAEVDGSPEQKA